ncbi:MAG: dihydropteroate synthase [Proteobacteria bacterium]|nr:dihydropteroate synthase [Pseudomonadota bacterium]
MKDYQIMGVLNVTPDSFSDGGKFNHFELAVKHAKLMIEQGADIIDVGGESTRPGAKVVPVNDEISRVVPVIQALRHKYPELILSIDTSKPEVMEAALHVGANFVNDVNALEADGALEIVAESGVNVCLMHKKGMPDDMQINPEYDDVVQTLLDYFQQRVEACLSYGITEQQIILDPGLGFGKTLEHNIQLLQNIDTIKQMGFPVMIGASRKSMIGQILDKSVDQRLAGSLGVVQFAYLQGADIFRVHEVDETSDVLKITNKLIQKTENA